MKTKSAVNKAIKIRPFSRGRERAAARSMLYFVGSTEAHFKQRIIGIASTWIKVTQCNLHIEKLALAAEKGTGGAGQKLAIGFEAVAGVWTGPKLAPLLGR